MCLCVLSAGINQSVCGAGPLPTMEPFTGPGAFYQYTHMHTHTLFSETLGGRVVGVVCVCVCVFRGGSQNVCVAC